MSEITYDEIKACAETVEVNRKALVRAYDDGVFQNTGNAHERRAKRELANVAQTVADD